eukprot:tig00000383_g24724.t1
MAAAPSATRVHESAHLNAPVEKVYAAVRPMTFQWWSSLVKTCEVAGGAAAEVGSTRKIVFTDGTKATYKVLEISDCERQVTYELIESDPPATAMSQIHTIKLRRVTQSNTTLVEWISDFSNDANQAVIQDSRFKKLEAFQDLAKALAH